MAKIGIIGGTGDLGTALALHLSQKNDVLLGSRALDKAQITVGQIAAEKNHPYLREQLKPADNLTVVRNCDILILTVPHENAIETIERLVPDFRGDQILVSAVAAVARKGDEFVVDLEQSGKSFALKISEIVPPSIRVAAAFQTVPANVLYRERELSADALVATNELSTYQSVASIISDIAGLRPLYLGSLSLAGEIERLTALLLNIGKKNKLKSPTTKFPSF